MDLSEVLVEAEIAEAELESLRRELELSSLRRRLAEAEAIHARAEVEVAELTNDRRMAIGAAVIAFMMLAAGLVLAIAVVVTRGHA